MTGGDAREDRTDTPAAVDGAVRRHLLAAYDLSMMANAPNYALQHRPERQRSVTDLERLFFQLVDHRQPELFIEAGAKDARSSRRARKHLEHARIVAFEGNPYVHARFREKNEQPHRRIEYRHLALTDTPGEVTFHVRRSAAGQPMADGRGSLKDLVQHEHGTEQVTVPGATLDGFFAGWDGDACVLWVDVEGAAEQVLAGAAGILRRTDAVFIEVEDKPDWVWGPSWTAADVADHLFDHGLVPVARDYQSRYQYNVLFVSPRVLADAEFRMRLTVHRSAAYRYEPPTPSGTPPVDVAGTADGSRRSELERRLRPVAGRALRLARRVVRRVRAAAATRARR